MRPLKFEVGQIVMPADDALRVQGTVERVTRRSVDVWWHGTGIIRRYKLDQIRALTTAPATPSPRPPVCGCGDCDYCDAVRIANF